MKPILRVRLASSDNRGFMLDCGDGAAMRIVALADDLVRVTLLREGEVRQRRTWAVPALRRGRHGLGGARAARRFFVASRRNRDHGVAD